jgi:hypothetical protein
MRNKHLGSKISIINKVCRKKGTKSHNNSGISETTPLIALTLLKDLTKESCLLLETLIKRTRYLQKKLNLPPAATIAKTL